MNGGSKYRFVKKIREWYRCDIYGRRFKGKLYGNLDRGVVM
jgi:hypothetical protein